MCIRDSILDNSASIISSNSASGGEQAKDGLWVDFGFNAPGQQQAPAKPGEQSADQKSGKAPASRQGLKRKLADQQHAPSTPSRFGDDANKQQMQQSQSWSFGGFGRPRSGAIPQTANEFGVVAGAGAQPGMGAGGVGGGGLGGQMAPATDDDGAESNKAWAGGAGLSLAMMLPAVGEDSLAFSKVGGDPKLVLKARSTEAQRAAWGIGELVAAVAIAMILLAAAATTLGFARRLSILIVIAAAAGFLFLPGALGWLALAILLGAAIWRASAERHQSPTPAAS